MYESILPTREEGGEKALRQQGKLRLPNPAGTACNCPSSVLVRVRLVDKLPRSVVVTCMDEAAIEASPVLRQWAQDLLCQNSTGILAKSMAEDTMANTLTASELPP